MLKKILAFLLFSTYLHSVELVMWHRNIGTDATGSGVYISKLYSPDSGYTAFSLPAGSEDNDYFTIQNSDEIACDSAIPQGTYTIKLKVSDGTNTYVQDVTFNVVAGSVQPRISSGGEHFLVLKNDGNVYSVGNGAWGRLGHNNTSNQTSLQRITSNLPTVTAFNRTTGNTIIDVVAGDECSFFLTRNGNVYVCGRNNKRQLGFGTANLSVPTLNTNLSGVVKVSSNTGLQFEDYAATMFLTYTGEVFVCGARYGKLGIGGYSTASVNPPQSLQVTHNILDSEFVIQMSLGNEHSAILTTSNLYTVGVGTDGQLGQGSTSSNYTLTAVSFSNVYAVTCGEDVTTIANNAGTIYTTGKDTSGVLGNAGSGDQTTFGAMSPSQSVLGKWDLRTCGPQHSGIVTTAFINSSGDAYFTGYNGANKISASGPTTNHSPVEITDLGSDTITAVAPMNFAAAIMTSTGTVYTIGQNGWGELAAGNTNAKTTYSAAVNFTAGDNIFLPNVITPDMVETTLQNTAFFAVTWSSYQIEDAGLL